MNTTSNDILTYTREITYDLTKEAFDSQGFFYIRDNIGTEMDFTFSTVRSVSGGIYDYVPDFLVEVEFFDRV
jgi:hypothetical protein